MQSRRFGPIPNRFVAIEGLDGVGKSTVAKGVAQRLQEMGFAVRLLGLFPPFLSLGEEIKTVKSTYSRYLFYLASNAAVSDYVRHRIADEWIICDRYVYSTQAYHIAEGLKCSINLENMDIFIPHLSFLITLRDEGLRQKRLAARGHYSRIDRMQRTNGSFLQRVEEIYRKYDLIPIDNSAPSPEIAIRQIVAAALE